jgi:hypothetical protein
MLAPMEIPGAAAAGTAAVPWLVLGVVIGLGLVVLAGLVTAVVLRQRAADAGPTAPAGTPEEAHDDLARFLESPPGSESAAGQAGWAALAPAPVPPTARAHPTPPRRKRRDTVVVLTAMSLTALLLLGVAAAVAAAARPDRRSGPAATSSVSGRGPQHGLEARLTFGGLVLEPRAVGVTATYPVVEVSTGGGRSRARVEFPTFNCLTGDAPADPVAAGCVRSVTEYAELSSPDLVATTDGDGVHLRGHFPTEVRPNGSAPTATGRIYELRITVVPADGTGERAWEPAAGALELGSVRVATVDAPGLNVVRSAS